MFWDKVAGLYDLFEIVYNGKVYRKKLTKRILCWMKLGRHMLEAMARQQSEQTRL